MYKINSFNGKIYKDEILVPLDIQNPEYISFKNYQNNGGYIDIFYECTNEENQEEEIKKQINFEFLQYQKRRKDGIEAYNKINAEFRVLKLNGVIEQVFYDSISKSLSGVIFQITNGQWISGLQDLEALGIDVIGQYLYDRLHFQISEYIQQNY